VFNRVLGRLAVTRAFGDFDCKNIEVPNDDNEKEIKNFVLIRARGNTKFSPMISYILDKSDYNRSNQGPLYSFGFRRFI